MFINSHSYIYDIYYLYKYNKQQLSNNSNKTDNNKYNNKARDHIDITEQSLIQRNKKFTKHTNHSHKTN